ncbi:MAG: aminoacyl-tRNA hydrolase [Bacteroidetes bacterium]|jgi:PTH1 family peptidyl-tRNA hydrolase|nr:aminoacyl-tRNA hydrolase [Bacteroidota bacterium]MBP7256753.1 aminoacyl-tRNA hydrolase [Chitinophagales bacterium]MBK7639113.1 aminoacyl-tRNA hydrolase [Bacteroidota bacterium]MBK8674664.1 aminoacyl-tRNA hydrolase [Bacteroidota bacterium]MBK9634669.1 aminoacyl-tRNA hydrolase [Bacteroidota bacterium]
MKFLIVGLGNIGKEYEATRHNIGFLVADALASDLGGVFELGKFGAVANCGFKGKQIVILKPNTYMNLSGKALKYWMNYLQIPIEQVFVIVDDLALPFGTLRVRPSGTDAGHNGLKSIFAEIGTTAYPRLKFGIGDNFPKGRQVDYVLGNWNKLELEALPERIGKSVEIVKSFCLAGLTNTMNTFSNK